MIKWSKVQLPKYLVEEVLRSSVDGDGSNDDRLDGRVSSPPLLWCHVSLHSTQGEATIPKKHDKRQKFYIRKLFVPRKRQENMKAEPCVLPS